MKMNLKATVLLPTIAGLMLGSLGLSRDSQAALALVAGPANAAIFLTAGVGSLALGLGGAEMLLGVDGQGSHAFSIIGLVLLDQNLTALPALKKEDLLDNGYSDDQAERVLADTSKLNDQLVSEKKVLSMTGNETPGSIRDGLKSLTPDASEEFLDVFSQRLFLVAQAQKNQKDSRAAK